jgi:hypothetical protein
MKTSEHPFLACLVRGREEIRLGNSCSSSWLLNVRRKEYACLAGQGGSLIDIASTIQMNPSRMN